MRILFLIFLIGVVTCQQQINVEAIREATQQSQMENKTENGEKYQKDKVLYLNPEWLRKVVNTHKFDIIYGICSDTNNECGRFQKIWHDLSLKYDKPDVLVAVLNSKDPDAKDYIKKLPNFREPYIMVYNND